MKKQMLVLTILNILVTTLFIFVLSFIIFKLGFYEYNLASNFVMLFTGIFSGYLTSNIANSKKLPKSFLISALFCILYLGTCFILNNYKIDLIPYLSRIINLFFGTFMGLLLSMNKKPKRKGFSK